MLRERLRARGEGLMVDEPMVGMTESSPRSFYTSVAKSLTEKLLLVSLYLTTKPGCFLASGLGKILCAGGVQNTAACVEKRKPSFLVAPIAHGGLQVAPLLPDAGNQQGHGGSESPDRLKLVRVCCTNHQADIIFRIPLCNRVDYFFIERLSSKGEPLKVLGPLVRGERQDESTPIRITDKRLNRIEPHVGVDRNGIEAELDVQRVGILFSGVADIPPLSIANSDERSGN